MSARPSPANEFRTEFKVGQRVTYIPYHANGDRGHPDCEHGTVSSFNDTFVFVKFNRNGMTQATAQACDPTQLVHSL